MTLNDTTVAVLLIIATLLLILGVAITTHRTIKSRNDVRIRVSTGEKLLAALCLGLAGVCLSMVVGMMSK